MMRHTRALDSRAARTDLTDRECAKLLGACIGGLVQMASLDDVRRAVRWWAENDEAWMLMSGQKGRPFG